MARRPQWRIFAIILLFNLLSLAPAHAQLLPQNFTIEGRLFDAGGVAYNQSVDLIFEVVDAGTPTCVLYRESHNSVDVSSSDADVKGRFSLKLGTGSSTFLASGASSISDVFTNASKTGDSDNNGVADCAVTPASGSHREVVIKVRDTLAAGAYTALSPNTIITSVPGAMVAETLQGLVPSNFIQVSGNVTQANLVTLTGGGDASALHTHDSVYAKLSGNNTMTGNISNSGNYYGTSASSTVGIGTTTTSTADLEIWKNSPSILLNATTGAGSSSITFSGSGTQRGRIQAAAGTNGLDFYSGASLGMRLDANKNLSVGGYVQIGPVNAAGETALMTGLAAGNAGALWYNTTTNKARLWTGSSDTNLLTDSSQFAGDVTGSAGAISVIGLRGLPISSLAPASGKVLKWNGSAWESADDVSGITALTGDVSAGSNGITTIANDAVTSAKILSLDPAKIQARGALNNQVLTWNGSAWLPASNPADIWSVTAGTGLTGGGVQYDVTLSLADTAVSPASYGSASQVATFTVDQKGRLTAAGNTPIAIPTTALLQSGATTNDVLTWNGGAWVASAVPASGISALTGDVSAAGSGSVVATLANDKITTAKIKSLGGGINRLLVTDSTTGSFVTFADTCNPGEVLKWQGVASGWACASDVGASAVTYVGAGAGLLGGPISSAGTLQVDVGTGANQIVQLDGSSKLPAVDGSQLTNLNAVALQGRTVAATSPTAGFVLGWNGSQWEPSAASAGDITDVQTGTGLTGGLSAGNMTIRLADTAVTANSYGSVNQVATFTVDAQGRLTAAANAVIAIDSNQINQNGAVNGNVLAWNGSAWTPTSAATGSVSYIGTSPDLTGGPISSTGTLGINTGTGANQILKLNGTAQIPAVDGSLLTSVNASKIGGYAVATTLPTSQSEVLKWNGSAWEPNHVNYNDLISATGIWFKYKPNGTACSSGEILQWNGSAWNCAATSTGDITDVQAGTGLSGGQSSGNMTIKLADTAVVVGTYGTTQKVGQFTVDQQGRLTSASNIDILINGYQINQHGASSGQVLAWNGSAWAPASAATGSVSYIGTNSTLTGGPISTTGTLGVNVGFGANQIPQLNNNGALAIGTSTVTSGAILDLNGTGTGFSSLIVPRDTASNRPTGVNGMVRYNTNTQKFEVYEGVWQNMLSVGGTAPDNLGNHTATVPVIGVAGAQSGPSFTFTGDTDTGFWSPTANTLAFSTVGVERLRINSSGYVGINTNNPQYGIQYLNTSGNADGLEITMDGSSTSALSAVNLVTRSPSGNRLGSPSVRGWQLRGFSDSYATATQQNALAISYVDNAVYSNNLTFLPDGRIGVGTATPSSGSIFDINGTSSAFSSVIVPRDTAANRPSGINGMIRYNTTTQKFEVYEGLWQNMLSTGSGPVADNLGNHTATSSLLGVNGSASGPAYTFSGDSDTGLFHPIANTIGLSTSGSERLHISNTGQVGIGINSPTAPLHLQNTENSFALIETTTAGKLAYVDFYTDLISVGTVGGGSDTNSNPSKAGRAYLESTWNGVSVSATGSGDIRFYTATSSTEKMRIDNSGSVTIGTTSVPGAILTVNGTGLTGSAMVVPRDTNALRPTGVNGMIRYNTTSQKFEVYEGLWQNILASGGAGGSDNLGNHTATASILGVVGTQSGPSYTFSGDTDTGLYHPVANVVAFSTNASERMRIDNFGQVGIGSGSPQGRLHIYGTGDVVSVVETSTNGGLAYSEFKADSGATVGIVGGASTTASDLAEAGRMYVESAMNGVSIYAGGTGDIKFYTATSTTEKMRIDNNGAVAIAGHIVPGAILTVAGTGLTGSAMVVPRDTAAFRPTGVNGMIRYNTTSKKFEVYEGVWQNMINPPGTGGYGDFLSNGSVAMTGSLRAPSGSVSLPAITFASDSFTGMWQPSTSRLAFSTGATERLRIDNLGNVGIGTNTPAEDLHVHKDNDGASILITSSTTTSNIFPNLSIRAYTGTTGSSSRSQIALENARGNLTTPTATQNTDILGSLVATGYSGSGFSGAAGIEFQATENYSGTANGSKIIFRTTQNTKNVQSDRMVIENDGRVGIGTAGAAAGAILDVVGTGTAFSSILVPRDTTANRPTGVNGMIRYNTTNLKFEVYEGKWQNVIGQGAVQIDDLSDAVASAVQKSVYLGNLAGANTGPKNTALGVSTLAFAGTGGFNTVLGFNASSALSTGTENTAIGVDAMSSATTSTQNVVVGAYAGGSITTGSNNIFVGYGAGGTTSTGSGNIVIGGGNAFGPTPSNNLNIGNVIIGDLNGSGRIGVGTTTITPGAVLDLNGLGTGASSFVVPRDTTLNRPQAAVNGMLRYNLNTSKFEGFQAGQWVNIVATGAGSVAGPILISPTGTPAAPAYSFNGEPDTGMYLAAVGTGGVGFAVNGTERLRVTNAGHLLLNSTSGGPVYSAGTNRTYASVRAAIPGNSAVLELAPLVGDASGATLGQIQFTDPNISVPDKRSSFIQGSTIGGTGNNRGGAISFFVKQDGSVSAPTAPKAVINDNGVGIGQPFPTEALDVAGNIRTSGQMFSNTAYFTGSTSAIDFNDGNMQILDLPGAAAIGLSNLKDGGSYVVIIKSTGAIAYDFTGCSTKWNPAKPTTASPNYYIYNILYTSAFGAGGTCFITWSGPF